MNGEQHLREPRRKSLLKRELIFPALATLIVVFVAVKFPAALELTIVIVTFVVYVLEAILQKIAGHTIILSLKRAALPFITILVLSLVIYATTSLLTMKHEHAETGDEAHRIETIEFALAAMVVAVIILLFYSLWKFYCMQLAEGRLTEMKDILIRVESLARRSDLPIDDRKRKAIQIVLKGLRSAFRLQPTNQALRIPSLIFPTLNQIRVIFFVRDDSAEYFRIFEAAYPDDVPPRVQEAFEWTIEHHRPAVLNEVELEKLIKTAHQANPKNWEQAYLNLASRQHHVSICGWIYAKEEMLDFSNASSCLWLDTSYLRQMEEARFDADILQWLEVGSFIGCRVGASDKPAGVLLTINNSRKGFPPEDRQLVVMASQIIGRIVQMT